MCVLVVEDDIIIRLLLVEEFQEAGFLVCEAATGDEALQLLNRLETPVTAVVTDIHMPGELSGIDVANYFKTNMPDVPIAYTTGRPDALNDHGQLGRKERLFCKPYRLRDVVSFVYQADGIPLRQAAE